MTSAVLFIYPVTRPYSGQTIATELAIRELSARGWACAGLGLAGMDRSNSKLLNLVRFGARALFDWVRIARAALAGTSTICFNHSQSYGGFLRMGLPHLAVRRLRPHRRIVTSLHGNVFATWPPDSRRMRIFLSILAASDKVTVLGAAQRERLIELGVASEKLVILPNTGDVTPAGRDAVAAKQRTLVDTPDAPLVLLHLSLLIESKGFIEYLEACEHLARSGVGRPIEIVLCGPVVLSPYCTRLTTSEARTAWIEEKIATLDALPGVTASWLPGAVGEEKARLFERAHVFVFPSRYPVEAQPLVLLEAMAAGCAIISSDQGEIPSTLGNECGKCLVDTSPLHLSAEICEYAEDHEARIRCAMNGNARVRSSFSREAYGENWDTLLRDEASGKPS